MTNAAAKIILESKASQDKTELMKVYERVSDISPKIILEIGTWRGYSAATFLKLFPDAKVISIELEDEIFHSIDMTQFTDKELTRLTLLQGNSADVNVLDRVIELLGRSSIDFLFIDGDHHFEGVKKDFEIYSPLVRPGGIVGFHDVALEGANADGHDWFLMGVQVRKFWKEVSQKYKSEEFRGTGLATGTGILYIDEHSKNSDSNLSV